MLSGKNIILGVTGGIAAYKAADICSKLVKNNATVDVIMTENACNFVTPNTFEALCHRKTVVDTFDRDHPWEVEHISLAEKADCVLIAPATANVIAKLANGLADDMLTTTMLAVTCTKLIAPAMNTHMYENPVVQDNIAKLKKYGWIVIDPAEGHLACGTSGKGKLPDPKVLVDYVILHASHVKDMKGLNVLVTAGPTCEDIDPVRYITNRSSGKMGYAIASAAAARGAQVTMISGPTALSDPIGVETVHVRTAREMFEEVTLRQGKEDIIIKAAAVADFKPVSVADEKIKKSAEEEEQKIDLERTDDILKYLGEHKRTGQFLCGFSMETQNMIENSKAKLLKKNLDLIAANNVKVTGAGFQGDTNVLTLISREAVTELPLMTKKEGADRLLDQILLQKKCDGKQTCTGEFSSI